MFFKRKHMGNKSNNNKDTKTKTPPKYITFEGNDIDKASKTIKKQLTNLAKGLTADPVLKKFTNKQSITSILNSVKDVDTIFKNNVEYSGYKSFKLTLKSVIDLKNNKSYADKLLSDYSSADTDDKFENIYDDAFERLSKKYNCVDTDSSGTYQIIDIKDVPGASLILEDEDNGDSFGLAIETYIKVSSNNEKIKEDYSMFDDLLYDKKEEVPEFHLEDGLEELITI